MTFRTTNVGGERAPSGSGSIPPRRSRCLMVYTADQVGDHQRRRRAVAIEPMTCPPDAFRTGTDLVELDPGESWQGAWGLRAGTGT